MVFALKPIESMAMGKALLLSDVSPHLTMVGADCSRARLFTKDSIENLKYRLIALINEPEVRNRRGPRSTHWIEQERTWEHMAKHYNDALGALTAASKSLFEITLGLIVDKLTTESLANAVGSTEHCCTECMVSAEELVEHFRGCSGLEWWKWQPYAGWIGSTATVSSALSAASCLPKLKRTTIRPSKPSIWSPYSNQTASGKPGALQNALPL